MSEPKQLTIKEVEPRKWYKASEFTPPDFLPCTLSKQDAKVITFSQPGAAYYSDVRKGWFWFGHSMKFPDTAADIDETTQWSPAL